MDYWHMGYGFGQMLPVFGPVFFVILLWSAVWKGLALWHSARRGEPIWFVILLVVNTLGIVEIVYLFFFAKIKPDKLFSKESGA